MTRLENLIFFEIRNNQLRIFPIPTESGSLFIEYVKTDDRDNPLRTRYSGSNDVYQTIQMHNMILWFIPI